MKKGFLYLPLLLCIFSFRSAEEESGFPGLIDQSTAICSVQNPKVSNSPLFVQVKNFFATLFDTSSFPARWYCGEWSEFHGWFYILSDSFTWLAYFAIPVLLFYFVYKKKEALPFRRIFFLFMGFIFFCGLTHLIDALIFWIPVYKFSALIRFTTAAVSMGTVFALIRVIPKALDFKSPEELEKTVEKRTEQLVKLNGQLEKEIQQRKNAEQQIIDLNSKLESLVEERTQELQAFTYSVSHDLRSPLRSITGYSQILVEDYNDKLDGEGRRIINTIVRNSKRMGQLIDDLLNLSRVGRVELKRTNWETEPMIRQIVKEQLEFDNGAEPDIKVKKLPKSYADLNLMRQVWVNLISNALKYTGKLSERKIEIGALEQDGEEVFYIKDNGVGFDMKYSHKLFGVFQRLHKMEEFEGTGVGLAVVHRVISRHDGKVWGESESNKGTTFYFTLPKK